MAISRDTKLALALQRLEEDEVQNLDKKEHMIMKYGKFATMIQHQEEDYAQKLMEKEQQAMSSTPTGKDQILVHRVFSLHHFLHSYMPHNLGVPSKVTTLAMYSMFFFADR